LAFLQAVLIKSKPEVCNNLRVKNSKLQNYYNFFSKLKYYTSSTLQYVLHLSNYNFPIQKVN